MFVLVLCRSKGNPAAWFRRSRLAQRPVGDAPSRVRRLVRWKKVRWRKLIADHLSFAVPVGEIAAGARPAAKRVGPSARKWRRKGLKRLIPRPEMIWRRTGWTYNIWYPGRRSIRSERAAARARESCRFWRLTH